MAKLIQMKSLESLVLLETSVTEASRSSFEEAPPDVKVEYEWFKVIEKIQIKPERSVD